MQDQLNSEALMTAKEALIKIEEHTKSCDAKYERIEKGNIATHNLISKLYSRFWQVATTLIVMLFGAVGYLLTHNINIT